MRKRTEPFYLRTRKTHKSKLDWIIVDLSAFNVLVAKDRPEHQGAFLDRLVRDDEDHVRRGGVPRIVVSRAFGATSGVQARYFAANGQTADEFEKRKGRKKATFSDTLRYAAVEMRVLQHLIAQRRIDWNLDLIRRRLFEQFGEDVLWHLCARFHPNGPDPGSEAALSAELRRKTTTTFRIVDLDGYRSSLGQARDAMRRRRTDVRVHEGTLLMRATTTAKITARFAWRAVQIYIDRVQGPMHVLPFGRFMALPEYQWEELIQQDALPDLSPGPPPASDQDVREEPFRLEPDEGPPPARASGTRLRVMRRPRSVPKEQQKLPFGA